MSKRNGKPNGVPAVPAHSAESEQARLDLEDVRARLDKVAAAIRRKDEAEAEVRTQRMRLRSAQRRLQEATWDLQALFSLERRKGGAP